MARVIDIVWVVLDAGGDLVSAEIDETKAEEMAARYNEYDFAGYHVKEAQLIWNE
jgi:hypothetical protein